ncbi:anti-sigma factor domain-containing protein [Cytobacillus horneckiae]|uniref:anti-sigma-I factor RsgI family protein n=1 Tax=Cytobacillus horneckiae TaxID=549687 RepID=UPI0020411DB5|nr:anti-sigma factor domain-containing protein [Cytobacillus horneckiae]
MKRGIIVDVNDRFLTLLTEEGEFLRSKRYEAHYEIGQELDFYPLEEKKRLAAEHFKFIKAKPIIASVLLFVFFVSFVLLPVNEEDNIYAYMSIDINPSIEIGVNEKYQVIDMISYNKDGESIVANIPDWKKKDFDSVIFEIINQLKIQGFVEHNKDVLIGTVIKDEISNEKQLNQHMDHVKNEMEKEMFNVKLVEGSEKERSIAKEQGVTIGQYIEKQSSDKNKEKEEQQELQEKSRVEEKSNRSDVDIEPVNETLMKAEQSTKASSDKGNDNRRKNHEDKNSLRHSDDAWPAEQKKEKQSEKKEKHHKGNDDWKNEEKYEKHSEERQQNYSDRDKEDKRQHRQQKEKDESDNKGNDKGKDRRNDSNKDHQQSHDNKRHKEWKDNDMEREN